MQIRNQNGMSQRQLSERSGLAGSYLSRIENRRIEPRPKTLRRIADALGVPLAEFFEERPGGARKPACAITSSGNCIMELLRSGRGKRPQPGSEGYTLRQLQLLRMANYLIQTGDARLLNTLDVMLGALLNVARDHAGDQGVTRSGARPGSSPPLP
jgi:DNA-binding XRE family transcriptional regulator